MSDKDLIDFGIWREMDADITDEENKREALKASQGAIAELEKEGIEVEWVSTDVLEDPKSDTECAYCHYRAPSEEAIKEHSERAGLPVTKLTRMDDQLDKEAAE
jgi:Asp-tRNA(Asn)/Glu-tRNA(Gln) amidotransferase A subunit family amidase